MDTIFVINVRDPSPAKEAGLQQGDRLVAVNNIPVTSYTEAVKLIVQSPEYLHLLIVPKEEDVIQRVSQAKLNIYIFMLKYFVTVLPKNCI